MAGDTAEHFLDFPVSRSTCCDDKSYGRKHRRIVAISVERRRIVTFTNPVTEL